MSAVLSPRPEFESARRALWHDYTAAILAGGLGTRLRPAVGDRPKVIAQIGQRPFITFLLDQLTAVGVQKVVLLTGHGANWVRATLGDEYKGVPLGYSVEKAPLGTAGALRHALPMFAADNVLLLNGDSYCELDLAALVAARSPHARRKSCLPSPMLRMSAVLGKLRWATMAGCIILVRSRQAVGQAGSTRGFMHSPRR